MQYGAGGMLHGGRCWSVEYGDEVIDKDFKDLRKFGCIVGGYLQEV